MSEIRIAVIGADRLDQDHRNALNNLTDQGRIAVYALDVPSLAEGKAALMKAVDLKALDAAIIACEPAQLRDWIPFALETGWPVYTPHPVTPTIEDMIEIRRAEQRTNATILQFGLTARLHDSVTAADAKAQTGEYGHLLSLRAVCGIAGADESIMLGPAAQLVDIMQTFAGPFQDVAGFTDLDRTEVPGSESNVLATLRTHNGVVANLHASTTQWRPTFRLELGYERGYIWLEGLNNAQYGFGQEVMVYARTDGSDAQHETVDRFQHSNGVRAALETFLARIADPAHTGTGSSQDAFDTLNTIQRILAADPIFAPVQERQVS